MAKTGPYLFNGPPQQGLMKLLRGRRPPGVYWLINWHWCSQFHWNEALLVDAIPYPRLLCPSLAAYHFSFTLAAHLPPPSSALPSLSDQEKSLTARLQENLLFYRQEQTKWNLVPRIITRCVLIKPPSLSAAKTQLQSKTTFSVIYSEGQVNLRGSRKSHWIDI